MAFKRSLKVFNPEGFFRSYGYVHVPKKVPPHILGPGNVWRKCYEVYPYSEVGEVLQKYQFLTKTAVFNQLPEVFDKRVSVDEKLIRNLVERAEEFLVDRVEHFGSNLNKSEVSDGLLQSLLAGIWQLGSTYPHITNSHIARFPRVENYWRRNGVNYVCFPKPMNILFSASPLQLFHALDNEDSVKPDLPVPETSFTPNTDIKLFKRSFDQIDVCGGCKRQGPYPFAHTIILFERSRNTLQQTHSHALMSMFSQTAAQTIQNGFKLNQDLVYPLSVQAILTDGRRFSFACYQLNTLNLEHDTNLSKQNLLWLGPSLELYEYVSPDGQLVGVNTEVMRYLCQFLLNKPFRKRPPHSGFMMDTMKKIELENWRKLKKKQLAEEKR